MAINILHLGGLRGPDSGRVHSGVDLKDSAVSLESIRGLNLSDPTSPVGRIGQLSFKEEAAGKIRVFAMVDVWTQSVLKPLHDSISDIIRSLPNDGTFDQEGAVKRCFLKTKATGYSYGYDLSAATDRLPISLQVRVMTAIFGQSIAFAWKELLVGRSYQFSHKQYGSGEVRYSVGQPMGALSSFNMLALTHHMIVQYCAVKCHVARHGV